LGFVALNPTYMLPVVLPNTKPNNGQFQNRVPRVSNSIRLAVFSGQGRRSCETTFQKFAMVPSWATLDFVGWVEPTPDFVGFRCTQPNLHVASDISKYETQQRPISKPSPRSFFCDQTRRSRPTTGGAHMNLAQIGTLLHHCIPFISYSVTRI